MTSLGMRLFFLTEYLDLQEATGDPLARWEHYQLQELNRDPMLEIGKKSRQIGWSWICAARAVADAVIEPRSTSIFVSINQDEATEKIRYARYISEALDQDVRPKILIDNRQELEFQNGSRLISHPCRPVRGKAKARVYLDEFAHYPKDREIYTAALPVTTRGGCLKIGSSPLGASGMFWEIYDQKIQKYPGFKRVNIPWWKSKSLCKLYDPAIPTMQTEERVRKYGTERLVQIFENMLLIDFQQEYECSWMDEQEAWIPWELIKKNQTLSSEEKLLYWQADNVDGALNVIDQVAEAVRDHKIENVMCGGMDIGRRKDLTEIVISGKTTTKEFPYRVGISLFNVPFESQKAVVRKALRNLPISRFAIDETGIGMQLVEDMKKEFWVKIEPCTFTNELKELWSVNLRLEFEKSHVPIPMDRELAYQIHSVKRKISESKHVMFDVAANEKHHADKYWALALAVHAGLNEPARATVVRMGG